MGLAHRIIPTFLVKGEMLVKGKAFAADRVVGHALQAIMVQAARGVDELAVLDVTATREGRGPNLKLIERLSDGIFAPMSYGGAIRSLQDVRDCLRAGADKVVIGTAAWSPVQDIIREASDVVGSQAVVASVDVKDGYPWSHCGRVPIGVRAAEYAAYLQQRGAGEILLQSIERDGTLQGYDLELIRAVRAEVSVPIIASGGCGSFAHMNEALEAGASAVAAGAMFQFTDATPRGAALFLQARGIEVRV